MRNGTARAIVDANQYVVLATASADGQPWSTPVYFAHADYVELIWVSSPDAVHSRNIDVNPRVGGVIFDSQSRIGTGQGVYVSGVAEAVPSDELERAVDVFSQRSLGHGGVAWTADDVRPDSGLRLYRATVETVSMLAKDGQPDHRIPAEEESA